jgi:hypothetical protein
MTPRADEHGGEQQHGQRAGNDGQPGASLQFHAALLGLRQLALQRGIAIDLAIDLEARMQCATWRRRRDSMVLE